MELLNDGSIDAVVIASETARHADLVEQAATAGKAVILQKPIALTLAEADRIVFAVNRHAVPFSMAWQMRADPHNLRVKSMLAEGRFGSIYTIRRRHGLATHLWPDFENSWHVRPELNRDIFADDAAHPIDFVYWIMGMPASVTSEMGTLRNPLIVNDTAIALFRYADGAFAEVACGFAVDGGENTLEIVCEKGVIVGNYGDSVSCRVPPPPGGVQLKWLLRGDPSWTVSDLPDILDQPSRIAGLALPLADFLNERGPPVATAEEGRDVLRMTLACYTSACRGERVLF